MKQPYQAPTVVKLGQLKDLTKDYEVGFSAIYTW